MTKIKTTIETNVRNIALNGLVPSKDNVRKMYGAANVEQLAASIEAHQLLQNLTVKPERDAAGKQTGRFEVPAGGRRLAALKRLAKRKRIAKDAPIPCSVRDDGVAAELSLAENIEREALHPADEFEAFRRLNTEEGLGADAIATRFGVSPRRVRERLKLAAVSPALLQHYRDGAMSLEVVHSGRRVGSGFSRRRHADRKSQEVRDGRRRRTFAAGHGLATGATSARSDRASQTVR